MISTVTLNPALDKTIVVKDMTLGGLNRVEEALKSAGGKGINVSKALKALETETMALGIIAGDTGRWIKEYMSLNNIPHDFVFGDGETRTNLKIFDQSTETITEFNEWGNRVDQESIQEIFHKVKSYAEQSEFVVLSGSVPKGCTDEIYRELISFLKSSVKSVLDCDGVLFAKGIEAVPSIVKPNLYELGKLFNKTIKDEQEVLACGRTLLEDGIEKVLVSMGAEGSILITKPACYKALPLKVDVKSTVGAGDSMVAGFLHALAEGMNDLEALGFAAACGTAAVMTAGTEMFARLDVMEIWPRICVEEI